ncbi:MAG: hypothetical protein IIC51_10170, partial [Planctomycetes bacterium]|nr:hypothetical protein [Planctomycetota bacterium]
MPYMIAKSAGRCGILIVLLAMHTGCVNSKRSAARMTLPNGRVVKPGEVGNELQEDLSQFMDYAENQIGTTADQIEAGTQDDEVRKAALRWKVELMQTSAKRPPQNKSMAFLMDAWTFCIRTTNYFQSGEGKNLFRDQQPLAIQAAARVQKAVETVARKHIAADQLPDVIRSLESYARANPMHGIFVHEVPESFSAGHEGKSVLSHVLDVPLELIRSGRRALDPTSSGAQALDRFTELMADYPALVRWQAQLLWLELENSTSFRTTMSGIESFSQNSERLIATAEALPQQLREELRLALDDIDGRQPELRKTLEQAQSTAEAVTDTIKQIQQFGEPRADDESAVSDAADPASGGAGGTNTKKGSFDITAYTQTAEALTRSTAELRDLLSEVRSFLAGETLEKDLARIVPLTKAALAQTATETRGIVDHIAWRAVQLCGLVFL